MIFLKTINNISPANTKLQKNNIKKYNAHNSSDEFVNSKEQKKPKKHFLGKLMGVITAAAALFAVVLSSGKDKTQTDTQNNNIDISNQENKDIENIETITQDCKDVENTANGNKAVEITKNEGITSKTHDNISTEEKTEKPLTPEKREEIIESLDLEIAEKPFILKKLAKYDDEVFNKAVLLIQNNSECDRYTKFEKLKELNEEQFKKAINISKVGEFPISLDSACQFASLDDDKYSKLLNFKALDGMLDTSHPKELYELNDKNYERAIGLIDKLHRQEYIVNLVQDDEIYDKVQTIIEAGIIDDNNIYTWQNKAKFLERITDKEFIEKTADRFIDLYKNGLYIDDKNGIFYWNLSDLKDLTDKQYERALKHVGSFPNTSLNQACKYAKYDDEKYQKVLDLKQKNIGDREIHILLGTDDEKIYEKNIALVKNGLIISPKINTLSDEEYNKVAKFLDAGEKELYLILDVLKLNNPEAEQKALELSSYKVPGYDIVKGCQLTGEEYQNELKKLQDISSGLSFSDNAPEKKLPDISEEEKKQIVEHLQKSDVHAQYKDSVNTLASLWHTKYISGIDALPTELTNKLLPYACNQYKKINHEPLARWLYIDETKLDDFINNFPKEGEIYSYKNPQSFAKTTIGAEIFRGNNFSDSNTSKNVKFVVYPKNETTQAYDMGEGKYGSDEAVYPGYQKFKVLHKDTEDMGTHKLYTIYMQEI